MADAHDETSGGNPYTFLFLLAGAMVAAVVFKAVHTGIPLTTALLGKPTATTTAYSAPAAITEAMAPVVHTPQTKKRIAPAQDHWTTITLDQDGRVMSVLHY